MGEATKHFCDMLIELRWFFFWAYLIGGGLRFVTISKK
jgi:hypothetical protein